MNKKIILTITFLAVAIGAYLWANSTKADTWTDGLVGYWSFDGQYIEEATSTDQSGEGNDGTIVGATPQAGIIGQALSFDGVDDYVNMGNDSSWD